MDSVTNMILSGLAIAVSVGSVILGIINHRRIVSRCCGRIASISLDINDTRVESPKVTIV